MNIATVETALRQLNAAADENPGIRQAAAFYQCLIPAINDLVKDVPDIAIDQPALEQKFASGIPLLVDELLEFDPALSSRILETIASVVLSLESDAGEKARNVLEAVKTGALDPLHLLSVTAHGDDGPVEETAVQLGLDPQMLAMLGQNALKVFLRGWRAKLEPHVDLESWRRSPCPICGADPAVAEIRGVEGARYLRCLRCGAGWPYPNLRCAFCGNENHRTLSVLLVNSQPSKCYIHACERCKRYIKTLITFEPLTVDLLTIEDLATLQLDFLAAERGYVK